MEKVWVIVEMIGSNLEEILEVHEDQVLAEARCAELNEDYVGTVHKVQEHEVI